MTKLVYKGIIEDIRHDKCTKFELIALIGVFEEVVKNMKSDSNINSYKNLEDFYDSYKQGVDQFSLVIERKAKQGRVEFIGKFKGGNKNLKIIANQKY